MNRSERIIAGNGAPRGKTDATRAKCAPCCFLHVDLDGLWTLPQAYGYPEGDTFERDAVFERGLPRLLELFDQLGVKATFFVVGRDLELAAKRAAVAEIARRGHELANHSYGHSMALPDLQCRQIAADLTRAQDAIESATGQRPIGFRAPGYACDRDVLAACFDVGMKYDGSPLPTTRPIPPLLRGAARRLRRRVREEMGLPREAGRERRQHAIISEGDNEAWRSLREGQQYGAGGGPVGPWIWDEPHRRGGLWRFPVAVSPVLRLPLQASMAIALGSQRTARALSIRMRRSPPATWLLHGLDACGPEDLAHRLPRALAEHRMFRIGLQTRLGYLRSVIERIGTRGEIVRTIDWLAENANTEATHDDGTEKHRTTPGQ